jgi:hypothetical protein
MVIFALEPVEKPHGQPITQIKTAAPNLFCDSAAASGVSALSTALNA